MQNFRNVGAWEKAHSLTIDIFRITEKFPKSETFGLSVQMRRYAMNTPLRIAEGCGKDADLEFHKCLQQARANLVELEYLLLLARDLQFIEPPAHDVLHHQLIEVRKMLSGFMKTLQTSAL